MIRPRKGVYSPTGSPVYSKELVEQFNKLGEPGALKKVYNAIHSNRIYRCPVCGDTYEKGVMACCVLHPIGTCCHEYDKKVEVTSICETDDALEMLNEEIA